MSAYKEFTRVQFANAELLVAALKQLGFEAKVGPTRPLTGFIGRIREQTAEIIVDRHQISGASNDLGFSWNGQAFFPIISNFDARGRLNAEWLQQLQATYSKLAVMQFLASKGAQVGPVSTLEDGSIAFKATVEVQT
jgi:hypothetical protein